MCFLSFCDLATCIINGCEKVDARWQQWCRLFGGIILSPNYLEILTRKNMLKIGHFAPSLDEKRFS